MKGSENMPDNYLVEKVSYRNNSLILKFSKDMQIANDNNHSYLSPGNYALHQPDYLQSFPSETSVYEFLQTNSVRFTLPAALSGSLHKSTTIRTGYVDFQHINYIKSADGTIQDLCQPVILSDAAPELSISQGTFNIVDESSLRYIYLGENQFEFVYPGDFYTTYNGNKVSPLTAVLETPNTILFYFPKDTFTSGVTNLTLYTENYTNKETYTRDIYGYGIKQDAHIHGSETIRTFSMSEAGAGSSVFKLLFDTPLATFNPSDFKLIYKDAEFSIANYDIDTTKTVVTITSNIAISNPQDSVGIYTSVPLQQAATRDKYGNKIYQHDILYSVTFNAVDSNINFIYNVFKDAALSIIYSKNIVPETMITDSHFDGTYISWDGSPLTIPPGNVIIDKATAPNIPYKLHLRNNPSFGLFTIAEKANYTFLVSSVANTAPCTLIMNNNHLSLSFSSNEGILSVSTAVDSISYIGQANVMSTDGYFLCSNPVSGRVTYMNPLTIEPLNTAWQNPFNGGIYTMDFLINVDTDHSYHSFGNASNLTTVNGTIHFKGYVKKKNDVSILNYTSNGVTYDIIYV